MGHYTRWVTKGTVDPERPLQPKRPRNPGANCLITACGRRARSRGWCRTHYERWRQTGDPQPERPVLIPTRERYAKTCSADGCGLPHRSQGYCSTHSKRWYATGSAQAGVPILGSEPVPLFPVAKSGEADRGLPIDTPIATLDGWIPLSDLAVGDRLFDEHGRVRHVTSVGERKERPCVRVYLSDGLSLVAAEGQLWESYTYKARHHGHDPKRVTTAEMAATPHYGGTGRKPRNHAFVKPAALQYSHTHQRIDPYVLGAWLGDGDRRSAAVTSAAWDAPHMAALIEERGYPTKTVHSGLVGGNGRRIRIYGDLQHQLRALGVLMDKHIPAEYLRSDVQQRLELLRGLMDTDGSSTNGRCEFSNTNTDLVDGVIELARSLGCHARATRANGDRDRVLPGGRPAGKLKIAWRVAFTPPFVPFRLPRKIEHFALGNTRNRGKAPTKPLGARQWRTVEGAERVGTAETVCIGVDSPSRMFLAGAALVPTLGLLD